MGDKLSWKNTALGVPNVAQWNWQHLCSTRIQVRPLAQQSGLNDPALTQLWRRQIWSLAKELQMPWGRPAKKKKKKKRTALFILRLTSKINMQNLNIHPHPSLSQSIKHEKNIISYFRHLLYWHNLCFLKPLSWLLEGFLFAYLLMRSRFSSHWYFFVEDLNFQLKEQ